MIPALAACVIPALVLPPLLLPLRNPVLLAVLPVLPLAVVYARAIRKRRHRDAVLLTLAWAAALCISTVASVTRSPEAIVRGIWHASAYRDEMLHWIATGAGVEGSILLFLPRVLLEYALVVVLSAVSLGVAALLLGALLLGYMNGYVGWVVAHADPKTGPLAAAFLAWPPWPMMRVVSFIFAGTGAALWGVSRLYDRSGPRVPVRRLFGASLAFLAADIMLKFWLAPGWRLLLRSLLGSSAGIEAGGTG